MSEKAFSIGVDKPFLPRNALTAPFLDGTAEGILMIQRCTVCARWAAPGTRLCPHCLGSMEWEPSRGRGTIFNWAVVHHVTHPGFVDEIPYLIGTVKLDEGPRLPTRFVDLAVRDVKVGQPVQVRFTKWPNGEFLPVFGPL